MLQPQDGVSLLKLFTEEITRRDKPIPFCCQGNTALLDNDDKLIHFGARHGANSYELYDLTSDPKEKKNLYRDKPELAARLKTAMDAWVTSINASIAGKDYPEGRLEPGDPQPQFWMEMDAYRPYFDDWKKRPEYRSRLIPKQRK